MNRQQRRLAKKNDGYTLVLKNNKAIHYMQPFSRFLDQLERDEIMVDQDNNILMDFNDAKVKDRVARLKDPYHAIINLNIMVEIAWQVARKAVGDGLAHFEQECDSFRRKILKRLELNIPIEPNDVKRARTLEKLMIDIFRLTPVDIVNSVKIRMNELVTHYEKNKLGLPTVEAFRRHMENA